jgi:hypothetical protein
MYNMVLTLAQDLKQDIMKHFWSDIKNCRRVTDLKKVLMSFVRPIQLRLTKEAPY